MSISFENRRLAREAAHNLRNELGVDLTRTEERDLAAYFERADEPLTFWCENCALEFSEPFCDACGTAQLKLIGGPDAPPRGDPARANQEVTDA